MTFIFACSLDRQAYRQDTQEQELLHESAQTHWEGIRWDIPERAVGFYELPGDQAKYRAHLDEEYREITGFEILSVTLDPLPLEPPLPKERGATVLVRVEGYGIDNVLRVEQESQRWYRNEKGWWVQVPTETPVR